MTRLSSEPAVFADEATDGFVRAIGGLVGARGAAGSRAVMSVDRMLGGMNVGKVTTEWLE